MGDWRVATTDDTLHLDIRFLNHQGVLAEPGVTHQLHWLVNEQRVLSASLCLEREQLVVNYRGGRQVIPLDHSPCHYGGQRRWMRCPSCWGRLAVLYLGQAGFLCRHCYSLPYASQLETATARMVRKARKLRRTLRASLSLLEPIVAKPKGMHRVTFQRLARLEAALTTQALLAAIANFDRGTFAGIGHDSS